PNPFNPATDISFELEQPSDIRLMIVNPLGQIVRTVANGDRPAGRHSVVWDGRDDQGREVASGVYIVRLVAGPMAVNSRAVLLR
ncbi:MAG: FlgD immunoglobulin-like domain containing protein, partial [Candidatus Latescibacteria bacterium]|nr:FlgD immunoglobulin-like domain containing protein [Candidatus Latescibacterota bacterium]